MAEHRDIVIAGGGMVGVSLALALAATLPPGLRIVLVEGFPFPAPVAGGEPDYHPSFDARSTALSLSSRLIYEGVGVWDAVQRWACPIETIHVSSRGHFGSTLLQATEYDWPALGYVVENAWLGNALIQSLYAQDRVEVISPARVTDAQPREAGVELQLEGAPFPALAADLLIIADGAASGLRQALGVEVSDKPYGQHALIANVAFARGHDNCAFERFTDEGPLALLPLPGTNAAPHRCALVWTLAPERAEQLQTCSEDTFLDELRERFGYRMGRPLQVGERHAYPLSLVQSGEQVRQAVVVMGNAAHALHPVAGQGFNLALRDIAGLVRALDEGVAAGASPGDLAVLKAYEAQQRADQARTIEFSDRVPGLFMQSDPALGLGRDLALAGLDFLPGLKREFVRYAAGVADMEVDTRG